MLFSYHGGHSGQYCRHAKGSLADTVLSAIRRGFTHYGLSEHAPKYRNQDRFPDELDQSTEQMMVAFRDYFSEATALQSKYKDTINLLVGFECEVVPPQTWIQNVAKIKSWGFDYVIGSVHYVDEKCIDYSAERTAIIEENFGGKENLQIAYFDQLAAMVSAIRPDIVGHFDLIRKFDGYDFSFSDKVWRSIDAALLAIKTAGSVLDVNASPARRNMGPVYPSLPILKQAQKLNIPVTLGDDSHSPETVGVGLDRCLEAIITSGYTSIHYLSKDQGIALWQETPLSTVVTNIR